jgi:hypothetical protein
MPALSNFLENSLLAHIFDSASYSQPPTIAIALCTTTPGPSDTGATIAEVTGDGYSRYDIGRDPGNGSIWTGSTGQVANTGIIQWTATGDWSATITGVAILDSATTGQGNLLYYGDLAHPKTVTTGDIFEFLGGELIIQMS